MSRPDFFLINPVSDEIKDKTAMPLQGASAAFEPAQIHPGFQPFPALSGSPRRKPGKDPLGVITQHPAIDVRIISL
jgi:hypothetical protein